MKKVIIFGIFLCCLQASLLFASNNVSVYKVRPVNNELYQNILQESLQLILAGQQSQTNQIDALQPAVETIDAYGNRSIQLSVCYAVAKDDFLKQKYTKVHVSTFLETSSKAYPFSPTTPLANRLADVQRECEHVGFRKVPYSERFALSQSGQGDAISARIYLIMKNKE
jgi:hypothetical protein